MWKSHWNLLRDPFAPAGSPYVSLPSHDEAVARLAYSIESVERRAFLTAGAGLGKSTVLRRAFDETRDPRRRFVLLSCPREETLLVAMLAERLDERVGREPSRLGAWRALERAIRLASIQGTHVVIGIDDCECAGTLVRRDIESIANLVPGANTKVTVIQAGRPRQARRLESAAPWALAIGLESLTRTQAETLLSTKLAGAGCDEPVFTARAVTRLHSLGAGVPGRIEQLAALCLMHGAARGLEVIPPELVDSVDQAQSDACGALSEEDETWDRRLRPNQAG